MNRSKSKLKSPKVPAGEDANRHQSSAAGSANRGTRETIESIVIAIILAFLFRAFEAEAFVIPTGSMAPTLQGRHVDVQCKQCGHRYRSGASCENKDKFTGFVTQSVCPICRFPLALKRPNLKSPFGDEIRNLHYQGSRDPNHDSFVGDRILVSKFAYEIGEPRRWDVIVFKYPKDAKLNYIKRLIGLPNETIRIQHGDIYVKTKQDRQFRIARKPPHKTKSMLQLVDDTNHIADQLVEVGWPSRWQQWSSDQDQRSWKVESQDRGQSFHNDGASSGVQWLRYRHLVPRMNWEPDIQMHDWDIILSEGQVPPDIHQREGQLITDFYAYNLNFQQQVVRDFAMDPLRHEGSNWVGDLAVVCDVEIANEKGQLLLDLVEGGVHYTCEIELSTGEMKMSIDGGRGSFIDPRGERSTVRRAITRCKGPGRYQIRFANVDDQLFLWIDDHFIPFDGPTTYLPEHNDRPRFNQADRGDAEPIGIASNGAALTIHRLQVLRDVYYVSVASHESDYNEYFEMSDIREVFNHPKRWNDSLLFDKRAASRDFVLGPDEFFPLGDNSPSSSDARYWDDHPFVERELMTGKALFIYWPHQWRSPIPYWPNFQRMRFIR